MSCANENSGNAVNDAEIDRLGLTAHQRRDVLGRHVEHARGGQTVEVLSGTEGLLHGAVVRDMRQHAQLDLTVIRVDEHPARARHEHFSDLAAKLRAHGDVLQIRLGRRQAAGRRDGVLEGRVDASVGRDLLCSPSA